MKIELQLTDEQVAEIAGRVAAIITPAGPKLALTVREAAEATGLSKDTVLRRIRAGIIPTVPGLNPTRVPADFITRMMQPQPDA